MFLGKVLKRNSHLCQIRIVSRSNYSFFMNCLQSILFYKLMQTTQFNPVEKGLKRTVLTVLIQPLILNPKKAANSIMMKRKSN